MVLSRSNTISVKIAVIGLGNFFLWRLVSAEGLFGTRLALAIDLEVSKSESYLWLNLVVRSAIVRLPPTIDFAPNCDLILFENCLLSESGACSQNAS